MQPVLDALAQIVLPQMTAGIRDIVPGQATPYQPGTREIHEFFGSTVPRTCYAWAWLLEGDCLVKLDRKIYRFAAGDFYFLPPLTEHVDLYTLDSRPCQSLWFIHGPDGLVFGHNSYASFGQIKMLSSGTTHATPEMGPVLTALHKEIDGKAPHGRAVIQGLAIQLAGLLMRVMEDAQTSGGPALDKSVSGRVQAYLRAHYAEDLTLAEIARSTYFTPSYLAGIYKRETGQTIFETLAQIRVDHAAGLLGDHRMPIALVSATVGYKSVDHFSRVFRRVQGVSPMQYRRQSDSA